MTTAAGAKNDLPTFEELAARPDDAIDVVLGAALVAKDVYETLDVPDLLLRFAELSGELPVARLDRLDLHHQADEVSARFSDIGFRGNSAEYYDARNSLLPDVLDRKLGIPITLSIVWCEIARRAGVRARGVSFPGHFLVRVDPLAPSPRTQQVATEPVRPVLVDPFMGGKILDDTSATELLRRALGDGATLHPALFTAASPRAILVRLLTNLKAVWASRGEHARAFVAIDRIVTLLPRSAKMLRERAAVALKLGLEELARADLARVLEIEPQAPDAPTIKKRLDEMGYVERIVN